MLDSLYFYFKKNRGTKIFITGVIIFKRLLGQKRFEPVQWFLHIKKILALIFYFTDIVNF